jgi:hypothetical protein
VPALLPAFWAGAAGAWGEASRWLTLLDCLPTDLLPPILLASAWTENSKSVTLKSKTENFIINLT